MLVDPRQPRVTAAEAVIAGHRRRCRGGREPGRAHRIVGAGRRVIAQAQPGQGSGIRRAIARWTPSRGALALFGAQPDDQADAAQRLVYRFQHGLSVRRRGLTYVLEIGYSSAIPPRRHASRARWPRPIWRISAGAKRRSRRDASGWLGERIEEMREQRASVRAGGRRLQVGEQHRRRHAGQQAGQPAGRGPHAAAGARRARARRSPGRLERVKAAGREPDHRSGGAERIAAVEGDRASCARSMRRQRARRPSTARIYGEPASWLVAIRAQLGRPPQADRARNRAHPDRRAQRISGRQAPRGLARGRATSLKKQSPGATTGQCETARARARGAGQSHAVRGSSSIAPRRRGSSRACRSPMRASPRRR